MLEKPQTYGIKNTFEVKDLNKITIKGKIGEVTFYGKDLTKTTANKNYKLQTEINDIFWKNCKETYYTNDIPLTKL